MKKSIVPRKENDAPLVLTKDLNPLNLKNFIQDKKDETPYVEFLPFLYLSGKDAETPYHAVLLGKSEEILQGEWSMCSILSRRMIRRLEGSHYTDRAYEELKEGLGSTYNNYLEFEEKAEEKKEGWALGLSHLVFLFTPLQSTFATIESFGTQELYFTIPLSEGLINENKKVVVKISDHSINLKKAASGFSYLASYKFNQWESKQLSLPEIKQIKETYSLQKESIEYYMTQ